MKIAKFDTRKPYFHNVGIDVTEKTSTAEVINAAELNYTVERKPLVWYDEYGLSHDVENNYINIKSDDYTELGVVGREYQIVNNDEAFNFLDSLYTDGIYFERAGHFDNYKKTFIVTSTEPMKILDDDF
jgi:hypothetical protein